MSSLAPRHLVLLFLMLCLLVNRPLDDADLFTQLKLGEKILAQGKLFLVEPFSYLREGQGAGTIGWAFQVIASFIVAHLGFIGLKACFYLVFCSAFIWPLLAVEERCQKHSSPVHSLLSIFLALVPAVSSSSVRPQGVALFCFCYLFFCVTREPSKMRAALFFALCIIWQNIHPSLSLGALLVGSIFISREVAGTSTSERRWWCLALVAILTTAQFITPAPYQIFTIAIRNAHLSRDVLGISEWLPPWDPLVITAATPFLVLFPLSLCVIFFYRNKIPLEWALPSVCFGCMSLYSARFSLFWAPLSLPIWFLFFKESKLFLGMFEPVEKANNPFLSKLLLVFSCAFAFAALRVSPLLEPSLPLDAIGILKKQIAPSRIYNYREWGGALSFFGQADSKIHIDGRLYLYDDAIWNNYYEEAKGLVPLNQIEELYHPTVFFLHRGFQKGLVPLLEKNNRWNKIYDRNDCIVFVAVS